MFPTRSYVKMRSSAVNCWPLWKKMLSLTVMFQVTSSGSSQLTRFLTGFPVSGANSTGRLNTPWEFW